MSLVYGHNNLKYPQVESKNQDFMDPYYTPNLQQQNHLYTSDLDHYRSHHTDFSDDFITGDNDDYRSFRSPSPEMDSFFANVMKDEHEEKEQNGYVNESEIGYRNLALQYSGNSGTLMNSSFGVVSNAGFDNSMQVKSVNDDNHNNVSGLARQRSSPAGLLSGLMMENEFSAMRAFQDIKNTHNVNREVSTLKKEVQSRVNVQYGSSLPHSGIVPSQEIGPSSSNDSWKKSSFNFSGPTGGTNITFSGSVTQNGESKNKLVHHLSLPTTFSEKDEAEKFLHFEGTVPCKVRAKRGFATHPRSIAERVRRNRISQRMRKLQELFPEMDKQTNTADMLDMAVGQIKELQKQVKTLTDTRAKCRCSGK